MTYIPDPSVGPTGEPVPDEATLIGTKDASGNTQDASAANPVPVSAAALPLPAGAATAAKQPALGVAGAPSADVISVQGNPTGTPLNVVAAVANFPSLQDVEVENFPAVQEVSATALPLPAGAATAAKQPALGVAGAPSADVISIQGEAGMTPVKVDGSGVTQPVSGSVAVSNLPATQPISAVSLPLPAGASSSTVTQPVSASSLPLPAGASTSAKQPALGTAGSPSADVITVQGAVTGEPIPISNPSVGETATVAPVQATEIGIVDASGKLQAVSATNPLPVTGGGGGSSANASVSADAEPAPTSSTQIGSQDGSGNLQAASATNPIPVGGVSEAGAILPLPVGPIGNAVPANALLMGAVDNSGEIRNVPVLPLGGGLFALATEDRGPLGAGGSLSSPGDFVSTSAVNFALWIANGNTVATGYLVELMRSGYTGTVTAGVLTLEGSIDGANFEAVNYFLAPATGVEPVSGGTTYALIGLASLTAPIHMIIPGRGFPYLRLRLSTAMTGTATIVVSVQSLILPVTAIVEGQVALAAGTAAIGTVVNNTDGPVAPGAAATKSALVGAEYTSASPAPTTGQQLALQVDALGNLRVNNTGGIGSFKIVISSVGTGTVPPVLTVPALTKYRLKAARVLLNSSSTTGNRMIGLIVTDNLANQLFSLVTPANTVASASNAITFGPSLPLGTAFVNNNTTVPIPEVSLGPGYTVAAEIVNGVSTDAVTLVINVEQYSE